jgi:hypothetical protein
MSSKTQSAKLDASNYELVMNSWVPGQPATRVWKGPDGTEVEIQQQLNQVQVKVNGNKLSIPTRVTTELPELMRSYKAAFENALGD